MKVGKIYVKFNFYDKKDDFITNNVIQSNKTQYGTLTFDDSGILTEWEIDKDLLKEVCDKADKEIFAGQESDNFETFDFCWKHSIKNKSDYDDNGQKVVEKVTESWFNELIKLSTNKDTSLIIYSWD